MPPRQAKSAQRPGEPRTRDPCRHARPRRRAPLPSRPGPKGRPALQAGSAAGGAAVEAAAQSLSAFLATGLARYLTTPPAGRHSRPGAPATGVEIGPGLAADEGCAQIRSAHGTASFQIGFRIESASLVRLETGARARVVGPEAFLERGTELALAFVSDALRTTPVAAAGITETL